MSIRTVDDWRGYLASWNAELLATASRRENLPDEAIQRGWLGFPGATECELQGLETRLRWHLPPSYRSFLAASNGWSACGSFIGRFLPTAEVQPLAVASPWWLRSYSQVVLPDVSVREYFDYTEANPWFIPEHMASLVQISAECNVSVFLLNPRIVDAQGEWEAWHLSSWNPGPLRYPSFFALIDHFREFLRT